MEQLNQRDYRAILNFLVELHAPVDLGEFPERVVENLRRLIPCDFTFFGEMDPDRCTSVDWSNPVGSFTAEIRNLLWLPVMREHPPLMHARQTGDLRAYRISDFLSQNRFQRLALYNEFYRKIGIEDALCKAIEVHGSVVVGCSFQRNERSFTKKDRFVFDLIGSHIAQARRNAQALSRLRHKMDGMSKAVEALDCSAVLLHPDGHVNLMTPWARRTLEEFFGRGAAGDYHLPERITRWIRDWKRQFTPNNVPEPIAPLVVEGCESRLILRLMIGVSEDLVLCRNL